MERTGACKYQWPNLGGGPIIFIIHTPPVQIRWCGQGAGWCHQEREILWTMERTGACKYQCANSGEGGLLYLLSTHPLYKSNEMVRKLVGVVKKERFFGLWKGLVPDCL